MIDVTTAKMNELVAYYNAHSGKSPIKKFADRKTAEKRVSALVPAKAKKTKAAANMARTAVIVDGEEYRSVPAAFAKLKLPTGRMISFRMKLKASESGKLTFEHGDKKIAFKIAA